MVIIRFKDCTRCRGKFLPGPFGDIDGHCPRCSAKRLFNAADVRVSVVTGSTHPQESDHSRI